MPTSFRPVFFLVVALAFAPACGGKSPEPKGHAKTESADPKADAANPHGPAAEAAANAAKEARSQQQDAVRKRAAAAAHGQRTAVETPKAGPPRDIKPSGEVTELELQGLKVPVPKEWEAGKPTSQMRLAQYVVPGPGGDAELVVFRFAGGAGGVQANIERWQGQFQPPEGKTMADISTTKKLKVGTLDVTFLTVSGRYVAAMMPGTDEKHDDADYGMLAAIIEGSGDAFFFKCTGPKATMDIWGTAFEAMLNGLAV